MIPLDRTGVVVPASWALTVAARLPAVFWTESAAFEAKSLADRRVGFKAHAPHALPKVPKGKGKGKPDFPPLWREHEELHAAIVAMSSGHCAYCQTDAMAGHPGHVDHVAPKSLFPSLAYEPDNYLLACFWCNVYKSDRWPDAGGCLRPDRGDPAAWLVFADNGHVTHVAGHDDAEWTIRDLKLYRRSLRLRRRIAISLAMEQVRVILDERLGEAASRRLMQPVLALQGPYSGAVRQCVRRAWEGAFPGTLL